MHALKYQIQNIHSKIPNMHPKIPNVYTTQKTHSKIQLYNMSCTCLKIPSETLFSLSQMKMHISNSFQIGINSARP